MMFNNGNFITILLGALGLLLSPRGGISLGPAALQVAAAPWPWRVCRPSTLGPPRPGCGGQGVVGSAQGIENDADEGTSSGKGYRAGVWPQGCPRAGAEVAQPGRERDPDRARPRASAAHMASVDRPGPHLRRLPPTCHGPHAALLTADPADPAHPRAHSCSQPGHRPAPVLGRGLPHRDNCGRRQGLAPGRRSTARAREPPRGSVGFSGLGGHQARCREQGWGEAWGHGADERVAWVAGQGDTHRLGVGGGLPVCVCQQEWGQPPGSPGAVEGTAAVGQLSCLHRLTGFVRQEGRRGGKDVRSSGP